MRWFETAASSRQAVGGLAGRHNSAREGTEWRRLADKPLQPFVIVPVAALLSAVGYAAELPSTAASEPAPRTAVVEGATPPESAAVSGSESAPAENSASSAETRSPPGTTGGERTTLNLLGEVDSSSGESRRNENVEITLIDNNVLKELNIRIGTTATIVQEFDADKGYFGREFGGQPSRQVHLASSRASRLHGNLYESHNNSLFSARSFFQVGDVKPARVNDYGFQLGSPLWRGANFSVDGSQQRNRGSVNGNVLVPRPDERTPLATDPETRAFVSRILESYPDIPPNRTDINPRALNTNAPQEIDNDTISTRLDQALSGSDSLLTSYRFKTQKVEGFQLVKGQNPDTTTRSHDGRITWSRIWSAATISDFSAGFDRVTSLIVRDETAFGPSIRVGRELQSLGGTSSVPFDRAQNRFRYAGLVRHTRGRHLWTAGFEVLREQLNGVESSGHVGSFRFGTDFLDENNEPRDAITNLRLGTPSGFFKGIGNTHRGFRSWRMQYFLGDQWKPNSSLTLSFGLRYQLATRPSEVNRLSEIPYHCDCNNFAPSFSFAYRPEQGWGVLRGAYGVHYGEIFPATYTQERFNPPHNLNISVNAPDLTNPLAGVALNALDPNARSNIFDLAPDLVAPYSHQYNFSWELAPARDWTVRLGYLGSRTHRLFSVWTLNRARDVPGIPFKTRTINQRRPNQRYFDVDRILNGSRAYYDAAKASLIARRWHGLSMELSYWFSKAIDLGANYASNGGFRDGFQGLSQTEFDVHGDVKGLSAFDQPHAAMWRFTYQTPRLGGSKPWLQKTFGQWELFSVVLLKAGTPFAVRSGSDGPGFGNVDGAFGDRPHVVDPSILGNSADHPDTAPLQLPKSAFAFIRPGEPAGNLGRNTFRKDGIRNVNFAVSRNWKIAGEKTLTFRAESINFFNTAQFAQPGAALTGHNFGEITNTVNDGRTFRFLLRLSF